MQPTRGTQCGRATSYAGQSCESDERSPGSVRRLCMVSISMPVPSIVRHTAAAAVMMAARWGCQKRMRRCLRLILKAQEVGGTQYEPPLAWPERGRT